MKLHVLIIVMFVSLTMSAGTGGLEECRRHATPQGWSDDITASMAKARAEGKDLFVYFPLHYDDVLINGKTLSMIKSWTNEGATKKLSESYVLVFYPWGYVADKKLLSSEWQRVYEYTRGATPVFVIVKADGDLVWKHSGRTDVADQFGGEGLSFATKRLPLLQKVLKSYYPVCKKIGNLHDEEEVAKELFTVLKECDYSFARTYFHEDVQRMVEADKKGTLGIREKYPFFWLVMPMVNVRWDFWNARENKIRELQKADQKLSRKEAGLQATIAMRQEWQPKFEKLIKVAPKVLPKLFDEVDRQTVESLKFEAEAHMKVWSGVSTEVPCFNSASSR